MFFSCRDTKKRCQYAPTIIGKMPIKVREKFLALRVGVGPAASEVQGL